MRLWKITAVATTAFSLAALMQHPFWIEVATAEATAFPEKLPRRQRRRGHEKRQPWIGTCRRARTKNRIDWPLPRLVTQAPEQLAPWLPPVLRGGASAENEEEHDEEKEEDFAFIKRDGRSRKQEYPDSSLYDDNKKKEEEGEEWHAKGKRHKAIRSNNPPQPTKTHQHQQHGSVLDLLLDLESGSAFVLQSSSSSSSSSQRKLRQWFLERKQELLEELQQQQLQQQQTTAATTTNKKQLQRSLKRFLHVLVPKIPAIKQSPDIALRIVSAKATVDPGLAAALIATLAHVFQECSPAATDRLTLPHDNDQGNKNHPTAVDLFQDRRFEQLIECLVCGVDVVSNNKNAKKKDSRKHHHQHHSTIESEFTDSNGSSSREEDLLQELMEDSSDLKGPKSSNDVPPTNDDRLEHEHQHRPLIRQEGLSIRDCCRAAWGLVILGAHHHQQQVISDVNVLDLLRALAWRTRELLLHRIKFLCQDDLLESNSDEDNDEDEGKKKEKTIEERLSDVAQEIAEDAAIALWTFGTVQVMSGIPSEALFQVCNTILCQNPTDLRRRAQNEYLFYLLDRQTSESPNTKKRSASTTSVAASLNIGSNDAVEKLARSEDSTSDTDDAVMDTNNDEGDDRYVGSGASGTKNGGNEPARSSLQMSEADEQLDDNTILLDWLSPKQVSNILWALAVHGERREMAVGGGAQSTGRQRHRRQEDRMESISETAATLCDISFDRILSWLQQDGKTLTKQKLEEKEKQRACDARTSAVPSHDNGNDASDFGIQDSEFLYEDENKIEEPESNLDYSSPPFLSHDETTVEHDLDDEIVDEGLAIPIGLLRRESSGATKDPEAIESDTDTFSEGSTVDVDASAIIAAEEDDKDDDLCSSEERGMIVDAATLLAEEADHRPSDQEHGTAVDAAALLAAEEAGELPPPESVDDDEEFSDDTNGSDFRPLEFGEDEYQEDNAAPKYADDEAYLLHDTLDDDDFSEVVFSPSDLCSIAWSVTELKDSLRHSVIKQVASTVVLLGSECLSGQNGSALSNLAQAISKVVVEVGNVDDSDDLHTVLEWIAEEAYATTIEQHPGADAEESNIAAQRLLYRFQPPELSRLVFSLAAARCSTSGDEVRATKSAMGLAALALQLGGEGSAVCSPEDIACILFAFLELVYPLLSAQERSTAEIQLGKLFVIVELAVSEWESGVSSLNQSRDHLDTKETSRFVSFFGRRWSKLDHRKYEQQADDFDDYTVPSLLNEKTRLPLLKDFPIDPSTLSKLTWSSSRVSRSANPSTSDTLARVALRLFTSRNGRLLREECQVYDLASIARAAATVSSSLREMVSLFSRRLVRVLNESPNLWETSPPLHSVSLLFSLGRLGVKYNPSHRDDTLMHRRLQLVSSLPSFSSRDLDTLPLSFLVYLLRAAGSLEILDHDLDFVEASVSALERRLVQDDFSSHGDNGAVICGVVEALGTIFAECTVRKNKATTTLHNANNTMPTSLLETTERDEEIKREIVLELGRRCGLLLSDLSNAVLLRSVRSLSTSYLRRIVYVYAALPVQVDAWMDAVEEELLYRKQQFLQYGDRRTLMSQIASSAAFVKQSLQASYHRGSDKKRDDDDHHVMDSNSSEGLAVVEALDFILSWGDAIAANNDEETQGGDASNILDHNQDNDCSVWVDLGRCEQLIAQYRRYHHHPYVHHGQDKTQANEDDRTTGYDENGDDNNAGDDDDDDDDDDKENKSLKNVQGTTRRHATKRVISRLLP
ncbi:hypothetical protein ACA910_019547 [Epithemia clementina (nom. ined.)]